MPREVPLHQTLGPVSEKKVTDTLIKMLERKLVQYPPLQDSDLETTQAMQIQLEERTIVRDTISLLRREH